MIEEIRGAKSLVPPPKVRDPNWAFKDEPGRVPVSLVPVFTR